MLIRTIFKVQARTSLHAGSLFLEKDVIFPTARTRQALKEQDLGQLARGSAKAAGKEGSELG